jgi:hypothetical protein
VIGCPGSRQRAATLGALALAVALAPGARAAGPDRAGVWLAGDLHVHTVLGHDTCATPTRRIDGSPCDEPWTWSFTVRQRIAQAKRRGLDFLAITDHNNIRSQADPAWRAERALVLVPAYESSLPGHAQMLGARRCYPGPTTVEDGLEVCVRDGSRAGVLAARDALRADGGAFQINHPGDGSWRAAFGDGSAPDPVVPDAIEVWNIGPWPYQPPLPAASDSDAALAFYDSFLDAGYRVAATGGSDSHWRLTVAVQGVGQPTTWVFATRRTWQGVVEAIRAGRTTLSSQPPAFGGPRLFLEADADRDGVFEAMVGDVVPIGSPLRARAEGAPPGAVVRIVGAEGARTDRLLPPSGTLSFASRSPWVRAELLLPDAQAARARLCEPLIGRGITACRNRLLVLALTSPIYQGP